jgi:hypothetical protein
VRYLGQVQRVEGAGPRYPHLGNLDPAAFSDLFCHTVARNSNVDNVVHYVKVARAGRGKGFMHRWKVGLAPTEPAYRKRRRRALAAQRKARRRERGIVAELSRSERSVRTATLPLDIGPALIVILLLSLGSWAIIWAAVRLALAALG